MLVNLKTITNDKIHAHGTVNMHGIRAGGDIHNRDIHLVGDLNMGGLQNLWSWEGVGHFVKEGADVLGHVADTTKGFAEAVGAVHQTVKDFQQEN